MEPVDRAELLGRLTVAAATAALPAAVPTSAPASGRGGGGGGFPRHPRWRFAFLSHLTTDPLFVALQYGAQDACALVDCYSTWGGSARGDVGELVKGLGLAVAEKADGIAVSIVDPQALDGPIGRARRAGIPVVAVNAHAVTSSELAYIGTAPREVGRELAERIVRTVGRGEVAVFLSSRWSGPLRSLADALVAGVARSGAPVSVKVVSTGPDVYSQLNAVTEYASRHRNLRGLFALDAGSTEGLSIALKKLGLRNGVKAGGYGVLPATLQLIDDGRLAFTVDEQPYLQGVAAALELFLTKLSGGLVGPADVRIRPIFVTRANLKPYLTTRTRYEGSSSKQKYPIS